MGRAAAHPAGVSVRASVGRRHRLPGGGGTPQKLPRRHAGGVPPLAGKLAYVADTGDVVVDCADDPSVAFVEAEAEAEANHYGTQELCRGSLFLPRVKYRTLGKESFAESLRSAKISFRQIQALAKLCRELDSR
jgi:hypothetical protein